MTPSDSEKAAPPSNSSMRYVQLANYFRAEMKSGRLKPGDKLPSFVQMQADYGIGQATLERVYSALETEKLIIRQPKRGTFVADASAVKRAAVNVIGFTSDQNPLEHPYYVNLLQGIQQVAHREQVEVLLLHEYSTIEWEKMDAVILVNTSARVPPTMPAVSLLSPHNNRTSCVLADEAGGVRAATQHLLSLGHRNIAFLTLPGVNSSIRLSQVRINAYREALQEAGIKPRRNWVRTLREPWEERKSFADFGYEKMARWLQEDWKELGCTAIMAHNDDTAIGILRAMEEAGLQAPADLSVVGFDGTEIAEYIRPGGLTTVSVPLRAVGERGMELLLQLSENALEATDLEFTAPTTDIIPTQLEIRASSARIT